MDCGQGSDPLNIFTRDVKRVDDSNRRRIYISLIFSMLSLGMAMLVGTVARILVKTLGLTDFP